MPLVNRQYDSGYDHGWDDADISDPNDRYINQQERGPSFHTDEFMVGYNCGYKLALEVVQMQTATMMDIRKVTRMV